MQVTFVTALYLGDRVTMCAALSAGADVNLDLSSVWRKSSERWFTPIKAATILDDELIWDALVQNGAELGGVLAPAGPHLELDLGLNFSRVRSTKMCARLLDAGVVPRCPYSPTSYAGQAKYDLWIALEGKRFDVAEHLIMRGEKIWPALSIVQNVKRDGWGLATTLLGMREEDFKRMARRLKLIVLVMIAQHACGRNAQRRKCARDIASFLYEPPPIPRPPPPPRAPRSPGSPARGWGSPQPRGVGWGDPGW